MAAPVTFLRASIRNFSSRAPKPDTKMHRFVASSCIISAVVLPFIPPAIESNREKKDGYPNHNK